MELLRFKQGVCRLFLPFTNGLQVFLFLLFWDGDLQGLQIPQKTDEWGARGEEYVLGKFPRNTQHAGESVDVVEAVSEACVFWGVGRS